MKKIAITLGDPAGIGAEITLKAIGSREIKDICRPVVIGDRAVIREAAEQFEIEIDYNDFDMVDMAMIASAGFERSKSTAAGGRACAAYIKKAAELAVRREVEAIVTAPISKESLKLAGYRWHGHTEMLAELMDVKDYAMMFYSDRLKIILATIHTALRNVPQMITKERILKTICLAKKACDMMAIKRPLIAVAGLNPHAGEAGIFGDEEIEIISPAVKEAQAAGISVSGPYPADALFYRAFKGDFDMIVCMYHDQGLAPFKMAAFENGVNVTIGLPVIRTSPDHGTAFDIAWKGVANPSSMIEAVKLAVKIEVINSGH
ncbi:MAG: 4-hydroxythreonine-4-phosphate dehydrogenase PdxA [Nitrospirae bacterium]|nr:4-hydroxythreonine-4-phosphate dehydrogenase PdxA [Nitrospirota bacterium]